MSVPRMTARTDPTATGHGRAPKARDGDDFLHVLYLSGGTDLERTNAHVLRALDKHGLRHAALIADASLGDSSDARKQALLARVRDLFEHGQIGPDTCVIVQLHGDDEADGFNLSATGVIDKLPWEELRQALRHPTRDRTWTGDVLLGCCEAGRLDQRLAGDEGNYFLLAGKKSLASCALREQLTSLFDFVGSHIRKKHRMPGSDKTWRFLTQISGENIRRVDALGVTRTKAGTVYVRKPRTGETGKRALEAARARQPSQLLVSKLVHGSAASVAKVLREHGKQAVRDALLDEVPPLGWLALSERDTAEKAALLFAADQADIRFGDSTLLHMACQRNHEVLLRALLAQGVDVDRRDGRGQTALHAAAASGHRNMAELLLERGARPGVTDVDAKTPLDYAVEGGHADVAALLRKQQRSAKKSDQ